jgi:hypothetical protein
MKEKGELYKSMSKENQPLSEHIPLIAFSKKIDSLLAAAWSVFGSPCRELPTIPLQSAPALVPLNAATSLSLLLFFFRFCLSRRLWGLGNEEG